MATIEDEARPASSSGRHAAPGPTRPPRRRMPLAVRIVGWTVAAALWVLSFAAGWTMAETFRASDGEPTEVLIATWARDHQLGWFVARAEDLYYRFVDTVPEGGDPTLTTDLAAEDAEGTAAEPTPSQADGTAASEAPPERPHLEPPPTVESPVKNALPKEGVWQPVASRVDGIPAVYVTRVRADDVHTSILASMMWIDTSLTTAMFIPGYQEPGGPNPYNGALPKKYWPDVLANWNGAFRLADSGGGYYYKGTTVAGLVDGAASAVFFDDGRLEIGKWGRDVSMNKHVEVVRQNLDLIVDRGESQVSNAADASRWGATTDGESLAWRSAVGQRKDGSLVYIGSPYLSAAGMADTLVRAGVERAMTLDMNNWWTAGFYFRHNAQGDPLCRKLDPSIQEGCDRFLQPYKRDSFQILAKPA